MDQPALDRAIECFSKLHHDLLPLENPVHGKPIVVGDSVVMTKYDFDRLCGIAGEMTCLEQERGRGRTETERKAMLWDRLMLRLVKVAEWDIRANPTPPRWATIQKLHYIQELPPQYNVDGFVGNTPEEALIKSLEAVI